MRIIIFIFAAVLLSGCQTTNMHGQLVTDYDIQEINAAHPSKEKLIMMIGSPTYIPSSNQNIWYYISRTSATKTFGSAKLLEQRIVKVEFLNDKVVTAIVLDNLQSQEINSNKSSTATYGDDKGVVRKFVDNIGRFRVPPKKKNKK
ncbi:MAG: outer membrane protein assembly factor BamE [Rickettsiaceae bacterium]|nr:outer membrane protein assembly factor BamE [Rickettsiaceae bacterium]